MNFINRAWKYITRKLSKSILLGLTFFIVGNLILVCLGVMAAAENAKSITRNSMNPVIKYFIDYENFYDDHKDDEDYDYKSAPFITVDEIKNILKDERVTTANSLRVAMAQAYDFDAVHIDNDQMNDSSEGAMIGVDPGIYNNDKEYNITIKGNSSDSMIEFENGTYKMVENEGRFYNQSEIDNGDMVAVITKELADLNGLIVG
ncbi:MAG: ABC transporter permease, partial [Anaerorhabdus sp.]